MRIASAFVSAVLLVTLRGFASAGDVRIRAPKGYDIERSAGFAISADGEHLAFVVSHSENVLAVARTGAPATARILEAAKGVSSPFWSPDGKTIAYVRGQELRAISIDGSSDRMICRCGPRHGSWGSTGSIIFSTVVRGPILSIVPGESDPVPVTTLDAEAGEYAHERPVFLPDSPRFIFTAMSSVPGAQEGAFQSRPHIFETEVGGAMRKLLASDVRDAEPLDGRTLLYQSRSELWVRSFDAGQPRRVASGVGGFATNGRGAHARTDARPPTELVWTDRRGAPRRTLASGGHYARPRISPDGKRIAYQDGPKLIVRDIDTETVLATFTSGHMGVAWSPDGRRIAAPLVVDGTCGIFVAGVGAMEKTLRKISARCDQVFDWSPDGRFVAVTNGFRQDGFAFLAVDRAQESFERTLKASSMQGWLRFSPDGTSVAFDAAPVQTDIRRGKAPAGYHVYLAAFAAGGDAGAVEPMSISLAGGSRPAWRRDGMELFFLDGERRLMSFRNNPGGDPLTVLFAMDRADLAFSEYDVTPDGRLFVVNREIDRGILFVPRMNAR